MTKKRAKTDKYGCGNSESRALILVQAFLLQITLCASGFYRETSHKPGKESSWSTSWHPPSLSFSHTLSLHFSLIHTYTRPLTLPPRTPLLNIKREKRKLFVVDAVPKSSKTTRNTFSIPKILLLLPHNVWHTFVIFRALKLTIFFKKWYQMFSNIRRLIMFFILYTFSFFFFTHLRCSGNNILDYTFFGFLSSVFYQVFNIRLWGRELKDTIRKY